MLSFDIYKSCIKISEVNQVHFKNPLTIKFLVELDNYRRIYDKYGVHLQIMNILKGHLLPNSIYRLWEHGQMFAF